MKEKQIKKGNRIKRIASVCAVILIVGALLCLGAGLAVYGYASFAIDKEADARILSSVRSSKTTMVYTPVSRTPGVPVTNETHFSLRDKLFSEEDRLWTDGEEIPDDIRHAFISIEDHRFYEHNGVDWLRTGKAALNYLFRFDRHFGGSTITQQFIKNIFGDADVSPARKIREVIRAMRTEKQMSKEEILVAYLNIVPMGHQCIGIKSAAQFYFNKSLDELTLSESAALAAITNAPVKYDPLRHPEENNARRMLILTEMERYGYLTKEEAEQAKSDVPQCKNEGKNSLQKSHDWYTETLARDVENALIERYHITQEAARRMVWSGGLMIFSYEDSKIQDILNDYFSAEENQITQNGKEISFAMTVCDPFSGELLATIGGSGEKKGDLIFNRAEAKYPPGSVLKPIALYAPAIESGLVHYSTVFEDLPILRDGQVWPHNSPDRFNGKIPLHEALAKSKNTVAVSLYEKLGAQKIALGLSERFDISVIKEGKDRQGNPLTDYAPAPLALGQLSVGVSVREMTAAFCSFENGGLYHQPSSFMEVRDADGRLMLADERTERRVWSPETAAIMRQMLSEVTDYGTAHRITLKELVDTAGKTGTSGGDIDKWFIGFTPYFAAGLHCSHDDGTPLSAKTTVHLDTWDKLMHRIHASIFDHQESILSFTMPDTVIRCEVCRDSGMLPSESCIEDIRGDRREIGYFTKDSLPVETCHTHDFAYYDFLTDQIIKTEPDHPFTMRIGLLQDREMTFADGYKIGDESAYFGYYSDLSRPFTPQVPSIPFEEGEEENNESGNKLPAFHHLLKTQKIKGLLSYHITRKSVSCHK